MACQLHEKGGRGSKCEQIKEEEAQIVAQSCQMENTVMKSCLSEYKYREESLFSSIGCFDCSTRSK